jgi:hypothetical protein
MAKKTNASPDTQSALPKAASASPRRRTATSVAEPATAAASVESVARHRSAKSAKQTDQPEVALPSTPIEETPKQSITITHEEISRLAFSYYEQRGYQGGSPEEDWCRAEAELLQLVG